MSSYLIGFTVYTLAMVGMIFLAFVVAKKTMFASPTNKKDKATFVIEETLNLGPRKTLHIVKVKDERFLISADAERTSFLTKLVDKELKAFNLADYENDIDAQEENVASFAQYNSQHRPTVIEPLVSAHNQSDNIASNRLVQKALERMR